jgi:hypothetical protein
MVIPPSEFKRLQTTQFYKERLILAKKLEVTISLQGLAIPYHQIQKLLDPTKSVQVEVVQVEATDIVDFVLWNLCGLWHYIPLPFHNQSLLPSPPILEKRKHLGADRAVSLQRMRGRYQLIDEITLHSADAAAKVLSPNEL